MAVVTVRLYLAHLLSCQLGFAIDSGLLPQKVSPFLLPHLMTLDPSQHTSPFWTQAECHPQAQQDQQPLCLCHLAVRLVRDLAASAFAVFLEGAHTPLGTASSQ